MSQWGQGGSFLTRVPPIAVEVRNPVQRLPQPEPTSPALDQPTKPSDTFLPRAKPPSAPKSTEPPEGWPPLPDSTYRVSPKSGRVYHHNNRCKPCPKCNEVYVAFRSSGCQNCADADGTRKLAAQKRLANWAEKGRPKR